MSEKNGNVVTVGFGGLLMPALTLAFAIAKLSGAYPMSWFWVFSPVWFPFLIAAMLLVAGLVIFAGVVLCLWVNDYAKQRRRG